MRAIIDTPRFVTDYNTEKFFYLLNVLNLNELPDIWVSRDGVYNEVKHFSAVVIFNVPKKKMLSCKNPIWILNMKASNMGESVGEYTRGTGIDQSKVTLSISVQGSSSSAVTKEFSYMLMKSGSVVLKARTDMKGYTPGQIIQVTAEISNQSGKSTGHMGASLVQVRTPKRRTPASAFLLPKSLHLKMDSLLISREWPMG